MKRQFPLKIMHRYVAFSLLLFLCVQIFKYFSYPAPSWFFHYLNDFLTIPIVAALCLHAVWLLKKDTSLRLGIFTIISLVAMYAIFFEYYLPQQSERYTGDTWDVVCYTAGGVVFYFLQKMK